MIHLNKLKSSNYKFNTNKKRIKRVWKFIASSFLIFLFVGLIYADFIPSKSKFSSSLYEPVAMVSLPGSTGSAFLVGKTYLITARHVVKDMNIGDPVNLIFEKANNGPIQTQATVKWLDPNEGIEHDFALLQLSNNSDLPASYPRLSIGKSDGVDLTSKVTLIGYPGGGFSITNGTISNDEIHGHDLFQIDVGAWPGSSGGPLVVSETEKVIGVLSAGGTDEFKGINMACKIDKLEETLASEGIDLYN